MPAAEQVSDVVLTVQGVVMTVGAAIETLIEAANIVSKNLLLPAVEVSLPITAEGISIGLCLRPYIKMMVLTTKA